MCTLTYLNADDGWVHCCEELVQSHKLAAAIQSHSQLPDLWQEGSKYLSGGLYSGNGGTRNDIRRRYLELGSRNIVRVVLEYLSS